MPLSIKSVRDKVEKFLSQNGLRLDDVDYYACVFRLDEDDILAGAGCKSNIIKCLAVSDSLRGENISSMIVSHMVSYILQQYNSVKVFTKPENVSIFSSLGFSLLASSSNAVLMENTLNSIKSYQNYLISNKKAGTNGLIVMNANPFSSGHRYLIETASKQVDNLYIIPVKEDASLFTYLERKSMIEDATKDLQNVYVLKGSDYSVSKFTFPTYFLKNLDDVADTHITLDLDLCIKWIVPALSIKKRFVGSEPTDKLTNRYNILMREILPKNGVDVVQIDRKTADNKPISASIIRKYLSEGSFLKASKLLYPTSLPYVLGFLAADCLQRELDTTPKPGLVDKQDAGAHKDMDYTTMLNSIKTLRPYFVRLALLGFNNVLPEINYIQELGIEAEKSMMRATNNVNTHRGALFCMGLAVVSSANIYYNFIYNDKTISEDNFVTNIKNLSSKMHQTNTTHGFQVIEKDKVGGALQNAQNGYEDLFNSWLPFYLRHKQERLAAHKTLLYIMSQLIDTNICYRKGIKIADKVREECKDLLQKNLSDDDLIKALNTMNEQYIKENISAGGSADMLSLTFFVASIL